ncbi:MAG TPA: hypothetical protein VMD79_14405 [Solirubrobacteraceae bacterium]|nr:hypothetical protein [Solirubrobacteraceae bacterium]
MTPLLATTEPPSTLTFVGALVVLVGTVIVILGSYLPGVRKQHWNGGATTVGNCVVGLGSAAAFLGLSKKLTSGELELLPWALLVLALVLIVMSGGPYWFPRVLAKLRKDQEREREGQGAIHHGGEH